jgi:hypothetical protein
MPPERPHKGNWKHADETTPTIDGAVQAVVKECRKPQRAKKSYKSGLSEDACEAVSVRLRSQKYKAWKRSQKSESWKRSQKSESVKRQNSVDTAVSTAVGTSDDEQDVDAYAPKALGDDTVEWCDGDLELSQPVTNVAGCFGPPIRLAFHDGVQDERGQLVLVPGLGSSAVRKRLEDLPPEAIVTTRVFRFFEERSCATDWWEKDLSNLNSGCLLWLPIHLMPGMHSKSGAKYGVWFTLHYLEVQAKHFKSAYHMSIEGRNAAKSFGSSWPSANTRMVTGKQLDRGYYWFVSPTGNNRSTFEQDHLEEWGWRHLAREGPFDGRSFMDEWQKQGSPLAARELQSVLTRVQSLNS